MNKSTRKILEQIARQINLPALPPKAESVTLTPKRFEYYFRLTIKERLIVHEELQVLFERHKCASLRFGAAALGEVCTIQAIDITEPVQFLRAIGAPCLHDEIDAACKKLATLSTCSDWLRELIDEIHSEWRQGRQRYGVKPGNAECLRDALALLDWLANNEHIILPDIRTLSVRLFGDTKRIEAITGVIVRISRQRLPDYLIKADNEQVMDYLGICKFAPVLKLKGAFKILMAAGTVDCSDVYPYLGIPPDAIRGILAVRPPAYILFIENETTFNRYTREITDDGWVIYTNGFPSRAWAPVFRELIAQGCPDTPVYHWGDIDLGGYRILVHMQTILGINLQPFRMLPLASSANTEKFKLVSVSALHSVLADVNSPAISQLARELATMSKTIEYVPWVEQERLNIMSPHGT
ncbi:Wadjet anti-phage system protein JetD domain-containing protein [Citrobacter farmeri]|uniref:Wadjet anti-phage system protein JetD domain-containing protein n=1 Tax=Citrobacter farmeri TaxID=67824 RepID=UPI00388D9640|nr:DUF2399 domain-containing protein [Citrobacter farmeri]